MPDRSPHATRTAVSAVLAAMLLVGSVLPVLAFDAAAFNEAAETILCDCGCHPQSVAACTCGRAAEMREDIRKMVVAGMSGREIIDDYVARYGEKILIAPEATGFNLLAWVGPLVLLLAGAASLVLIVRRWSRKDVAASEEPVVTVPAGSSPQWALGR